MRTRVRIHPEALAANLGVFHRITGRPVAFVVKANAYGHGIETCVAIARELDSVACYAVDAPAEALRVLNVDDRRPILVMGWATDGEIDSLIREGVEMVVPSGEYLERVRASALRQKKSARCHLKVETGTHRLGMAPDEALRILSRGNDPAVEFIGIYSHFANIEDTTQHDFARGQLNVFRRLLDELPAESGLCRHMACSAAALLFPETHFDMVRVGISAYGYWPSPETLISWKEKNGNSVELKPALSWETHVAQVKSVARGDSIGYGLSYRAFSDSRIAVIPVGYYDGYDRRLSNSGVVMVKGVHAPIRGRICMNMMMVDVTHIPDVREGDPVTLLGAGRGGIITAADLAEKSGTIHYEILSRIGAHLPRVVEDSPV